MDFSILAGIITWVSLFGVLVAVFFTFRADRKLTPEILQRLHAKWASKSKDEVRAISVVNAPSLDVILCNTSQVHSIAKSPFRLTKVGWDNYSIDDTPKQSDVKLIEYIATEIFSGLPTSTERSWLGRVHSSKTLSNDLGSDTYTMDDNKNLKRGVIKTDNPGISFTVFSEAV